MTSSSTVAGLSCSPFKLGSSTRGLKSLRILLSISAVLLLHTFQMLLLGSASSARIPTDTTDAFTPPILSSSSSSHLVFLRLLPEVAMTSTAC